MKSNEEILQLEKTLLKLENLHASFDYLKISIASPKRIKSWCEKILPNGEIIGEILKPETINFRTHQPETSGLFCEKIFGPIKNWKCKCGKYNGFVLDKICEECLVEVIEARVRRYRMGYIELTCPVTHLWYLKGLPSYLVLILRFYNKKINVNQLEQIVYFKEGEDPEQILPLFVNYSIPNDYLEDNANNELKVFKIINNDDENSDNLSLKENEINSSTNIKTELIKAKKKFKTLKKSIYKKRKGAEIIKAALENLDLKSTIEIGRNTLINKFSEVIVGNYVPDTIIIRRIRILESFLATKTNPAWMILTILPVLPPNLRPLLELESGRLVAADVNEIYRLIITRNQRLFDFIYNFRAPDIIGIQSRKLLQEGVDSLIDNGKLAKEKKFCLNNKPLKSLTEILEGKQGRFRQSLLGKRVDYSGRSVIIVGPNLRLNECGLPYEMARELFQPFLINQLLKTKIKAPSHNTKLAQIIIKKNKPFIWTLLESLTKKHSILLNRAPTLHRFGIQAFDPVIILGQAIHLHPLVCTGFNADFDGDQMAVHLPLYEASQLEARTMMRPSYNVLSPSNGDVILKPTQDMVIGCYYLTLMIPQNKYILKKWFGNEHEAITAFYQKKLTLHSPILVRYSLNNFQVFYSKAKLEILNLDYLFKEKTKKIIISKVFKIKNIENKFYFITNLGIFIARYQTKNKYELSDFFLETTPGRLIFSMNFRNSIKK